jgi:hypothetical protein
MLSAAKHLAALSMTRGACSNGHVLFFTLNLALQSIIGQMEGQGYQDEFVKTHLIIALPGQKGKTKKMRRKRATVARYSMLYRFLCNAMQRASQKTKKIRRKRATVARYLLTHLALAGRRK